MANNSPIVSIRVPPLMLAAIDARIAATKSSTRKPVTRTQWLLWAASEQLDRQGPKKSKRRKSAPSNPKKKV